MTLIKQEKLVFILVILYIRMCFYKIVYGYQGSGDFQFRVCGSWNSRKCTAFRSGPPWTNKKALHNINKSLARYPTLTGQNWPAARRARGITDGHFQLSLLGHQTGAKVQLGWGHSDGWYDDHSVQGKFLVVNENRSSSYLSTLITLYTPPGTNRKHFPFNT